MTTELTQPKTLGEILKSKSSGTFINSNNEYCMVSRYYVKNTQYFMIIFSKSLNELATRFAIKTTSEKKVLKLLKDENFKLV